MVQKFPDKEDLFKNILFEIVSSLDNWWLGGGKKSKRKVRLCECWCSIYLKINWSVDLYNLVNKSSRWLIFYVFSLLPIIFYFLNAMSW